MSVGYARILLLGCGVLAGGLSLGVARQRTGSIDGWAFRSRDAGEYHQLAVNLARHGVFSQSVAAPWVADTWRTPGYPLFLAIFCALLGAAPAALIVIQQILAAGNVLLLFEGARPALGSRRALAVALLFACAPYHHFYSLWLLATTLFVTALLAGWCVWQRALRTRRGVWFVLTGVCCGITVLIRPVGLLLPAGVGLAVLGIRCGSRWRRVAACGLILAGTAATLAPWVVRNRAVAGHWALSSQGGGVLAYFKVAEVVLWRQGRADRRIAETSLDPRFAGAPHTVWEDIDARLRNSFSHLPAECQTALRWSNLAQGNRTELDSFELSRALARVGWGYIREAPAATLACCLLRCGLLLAAPLDLYLTPPPATPRRAVHGLLGAIYAGLAAAVGLRLVRGRWTAAAVYPAVCCVALLLASTPQLDPRFRVPMIPFLLVLACLPLPKARGRQQV